MPPMLLGEGSGFGRGARCCGATRGGDTRERERRRRRRGSGAHTGNIYGRFGVRKFVWFGLGAGEGSSEAFAFLAK
jgi:hypothetical protein